MKILLLGGTSYLGRKIITRLSKNNEHEISVLTRPSSTHKLQGLRIKSYYEENLETLPPQDLVFNLVVDYGKNKPLWEVMEANMNFPLRQLEKIKFKTLINFSTGISKKISHYSFTKKLLEESLSFVAEQNNWQIINLQLQHFFGPGAPDHNFITFLIQKMKKNEEIALSDCQQKRDFIYTEDLLDSVEVIMKNLSTMGSDEGFEIGSGTAVRLQDFVEEIKKLTGSTSVLKFGALPRRPNEPAELSADITRIKELGWSQKTSITDALKLTIAGHP